MTMPVSRPRRVGLIGAGFIAGIHAEALRRVPGTELSAVVDPAPGRAEALARRWGIPRCFASVDELLADGGVDAAHVLVPPPLHRPVAEPLLRAGIDVLLEKPMAESATDCAALQDAARAGGAALHVNQNAAHHPAHRRLADAVAAGTLGRLRHVSCLFSMPLAQYSARQFGHWMFREPRNLLLEQAVHPLSQIEDLVGPVGDVAALSPPPVRTANDRPLPTVWSASLAGERATAQLHFAVAESFPVWTVTALCEDGAIVADIAANRVTRAAPTRWMEAIDLWASGWSQALQAARDSQRGLLDYALSTLRLRPRGDPFFLGMAASVAAFHRALDTGGAGLDGAAARRLVALCERMAAAAPVPAPTLTPAPAPAVLSNRAADALVIGGTGFIGRHVVSALCREGRRVTVMARRVDNLPAELAHPAVAVLQGDVQDEAAVRRAVADVPVVVNLAHGGGAETWPALERAIVGGARTVAAACLDAGTERLVHVSSIAALALGNRHDTVTGAAPPDPRADRRDGYTRAKAEAERLLAEWHRTRGLPVVVLRPGVVVGRDGVPFHSGIGFYYREQHCLGWNRGSNPLPLVLVEDVADAVMRATTADGVPGKAYNLVGDVRLTAREYTAALAARQGRPLRFHPRALPLLYAEEVGKWLVKIAAGRRDAPFPEWGDLASRGMVARFDTADAKADLGWRPVAARDLFVDRAFPPVPVAAHAG